MCTVSPMKTARFVVSVLSALAFAGAIASRASADPQPVGPLAGVAFQPAQPDPLASVASIVAFAPTSEAAHVHRISLVPADALHCDADNYRALYIVDVDSAGTMAPALYIGATTCTGSGNWEAGRVAFTIPLTHDLLAGHSLAAMWRAEGNGVAIPSGAWRVETQ